MIYLTDTIVATDADILGDTRLSSIPYVGTLVLEFSGSLNTTTNHYLLTIQLPDGSVPVDSQRVTANAAALEGILDDRTVDRFSFPSGLGGHFTISLTEVGTATCAWRVVLAP